MVKIEIMKIRRTTSNRLDLDRCHQDDDPEQYSKSISRRTP